MQRTRSAAWIGLIGLCLLVTRPLGAAEPEAPRPGDKKVAAEDPMHNELRALRDGLVAAVNKGDLEGILGYCHPNIRFTTPDAVMSQGVAGVRSYYEAKTKGPNRVVQSFSTHPTVDNLSSLYGGATAVASGTSVDHFKLTNGMEFDLKARWSATLVKENGRWLIANYHTATNVFDNPLLNAATKGLYWIGGLCLVVGIMIGLLVTWVLRRRTPKPAQ